MSDLISRSTLISHIENERREWGEDYDVEQILGDIEDAPTAYDPDKVVEQLEKVTFERYENDGMGGERVVNLDDVVEIVKGGVVGG